MDDPYIDNTTERRMNDQARKALELAKAAIFRMDIFGNEDEAIAAIDAALASPAAPVAQPLTDERVLHEFDIYVGQPVAGYPLDSSDVIAFARAIERAHGIGQGGA